MPYRQPLRWSPLVTHSRRVPAITTSGLSFESGVVVERPEIVRRVAEFQSDRVLLKGPPGSGKTATLLLIARALQATQISFAFVTLLRRTAFAAV